MEELQFLFDGFIQLWMLLGDPGAQVCVDASGVSIDTTGLVSNSIDIGATEPIVRPAEGLMSIDIGATEPIVRPLVVDP